MKPLEQLSMQRENSYLKLRLGQLQDDVSNLSAEAERLRQRLEGIGVRRAAAAPPNPLAGGQ